VGKRHLILASEQADSESVEVGKHMGSMPRRHGKSSFSTVRSRWSGQPFSLPPFSRVSASCRLGVPGDAIRSLILARHSREHCPRALECKDQGKASVWNW